MTPTSVAMSVPAGIPVRLGARELPSGGVRIVGTAGQTVPFVAGMVLPKGHVASGAGLVASETGVYVTVKRTWNDGSPKHVILSGLATLGPSGGKTIHLHTGTPTGTNMTEADIVSAAPSASVTLGALGTVNLSSLLGSPFRTWLATPNMIECHYLSKSLGASYYVWFHVRRWAAGHTSVRVVVEYSSIPYTSATTSVYVPSVSIGGVEVWNNGGANFIHSLESRWTVEGWAHGGAAYTLRHDLDMLRAAKIAPDYYSVNPSEATLNALTQAYVPGSFCNLRDDYPGTGYHGQIGMLPHWDVLYLTTGDDRAYRSVIANSLAMGTHATMWRNPATGLPYKPSERATQGYQNTPDGSDEIACRNQSNVQCRWDISHHASSGYIAYLLTGDYIHLETMQMQCMTIYMLSSYASGGASTSRIVFGQIRGTGWYFRTVGQCAAVAPNSDPLLPELQAWLTTNTNYHKVNGPDATPDSGLGYPMVAYAYNVGATVLRIAPWMQNFWNQSVGHLTDIEPLADMSGLTALRNWMYRAPVGQLGDGSAGTYDFRYGGAYNVSPTPLLTTSRLYPDDLHQNWGDVWTETIPYLESLTEGGLYVRPSNSSPNTVHPSGQTGDWGSFQSLMASIAMAAGHGAPGAFAGMQRVFGAANWTSLRNNTLTRPPWCVQPRRAITIPAITDAPSVWPAWRQAQAPNTWALIPASNTLSAIDPEDNATYNPVAPAGAIWHGNGGLAEVVRAWSGAVLDPATDRMVVWGGGHGDYAGNEPYRITLSVAAPAWTMLHPPSGSGVVGQTAAYLENTSSPATVGTYFDGKPRSQHTYDKLVWLPGRGMLLGRNIGGFPTGDLGDNRSYLLNIDTGEWSVFAQAAASNAATVNAYCLDTTRNIVWRFTPGASEVYKLPVDAPVWAAQATTGWNGTGASQHFYVSCEYIAEHDICVVLSGRSALTGSVATYPSQLRVFDCATNTWYLPTMTDFSVTAAVIHNWGYTHPAWTRGAVWIWHNQPSYLNQIVRLTPGANPSTDAWTADLVTAASGATSAKVGGDGAEDRGTYGRFSYSPNLDGFVLLNSHTQQPYFFALS